MVLFANSRLTVFVANHCAKTAKIAAVFVQHKKAAETALLSFAVVDFSKREEVTSSISSLTRYCRYVLFTYRESGGGGTIAATAGSP